MKIIPQPEPARHLTEHDLRRLEAERERQRRLRAIRRADDDPRLEVLQDPNAGVLIWPPK